MNLAFRLSWESVDGALSYQITQLDGEGVESELATTTDCAYTATIDDGADAVFLIRAFDGANYDSPLTIVYSHTPTLTDLRARVRRDLRDLGTGVAPNLKFKWTDDEIDGYLRDAIGDYGEHFPKPGSLTIECVAGHKTYRLPAEVRGLDSVEYVAEAGNALYLTHRPFRGGESTGSGGAHPYWKLGISSEVYRRTRRHTGSYDFRDGAIELDFSPALGASLRVEYRGRYLSPPNGFVRLDVPVDDHELLVLYACGKATVRVEGQDANLSRWDETTGRRDDNPLTPLTNRYFNAYNQKIKERQSRPRVLRVTRI